MPSEPRDNMQQDLNELDQGMAEEPVSVAEEALDDEAADAALEDAAAIEDAVVAEGADDAEEALEGAEDAEDGANVPQDDIEAAEGEAEEDVPQDEANAYDDYGFSEEKASDTWSGGDYLPDASANEGDELPFDEYDAFSPSADQHEFLTGTSDDWVDDSQRDYYRYGDKVHNVKEEVINTNTAAGGLGRHGRGKSVRYAALDEHQRRSRRTRRVLLAVLLLLLVLLGALAYLGLRLFQESADIASQNIEIPTAEIDEAANKSEAVKEGETAVEKRTEVIELVPLIGMTPTQATETIKHGATVTHDTAIEEEGNPVKKRQTVVLTEEPADAKSGAPTVYLGTDEAGTVIQAGYSAATTSLGYGNLSFSDAVTKEHVIEKTLREVGLSVEDGTVTLPAQSEYSTYANDGKTLVKEQCAFEGLVGGATMNYKWSAVLLYNYTAANASGNLADTVRTIFVYVDKA